MSKSFTLSLASVGARANGSGAIAPAAALLTALVAMGCANNEKAQRFDPIVLGMNDQVAASFEGDEVTYYDVKMPVQLPLIAPTDTERRGLMPIDPYRRAPWVLEQDVDVQINWTLSNLDPDSHNVHILVDPWNEFGRYWPGVAVVDDEEIPNLSGIQLFRELPGTNDSLGRDSRLRGTFTWEDMEELAIDFATAMKVIQDVPPPDPAAGDSGGGPVTYVNHAFTLRNRSHSDPLVQPYIPAVIAGLTGFDIGLRTLEPANIAIEIVVEIVDRGRDRVPDDEDYACLNGECTWQGDAEHELIRPPRDVITLGG